MSIERIKQDAAKADQLIMELARGKSAEEPTIEQPEAGEPEVVSDDQVVPQPAATDDVPSVAPDADELAQLREAAAKWEQRYRSLDGMIQARDRQIEQLHQLIAGMQAAPKSEPEPQAQSKRTLVSEKDEEAFGADLIDLARRIAKEESGDIIAALQQKVVELTERLEGVSQTTAVTVQDRFESQLTAAAPAWRKTDADPKFIEWLQASPTRQKLFAEAVRAHEVADVAYFYNEYAEKHVAPPPPATDPRLEKQIAPGRSKAVAPPAKNPAEKKQWTRSEIADFYAHGKKRFSAEEYSRMERDIFAAQKEGRVDFRR